MNKIMIVASDMEIGGAERALLGLLDAFDTDLYKIDLFLLRHQGPFMKFIPDKINVLPEKKLYSDLGIPLSEVLKRRHLKMFFLRILGKIKAIQFIKKNHLSTSNSVEIHYSYKYTREIFDNISDEEYDLALGFSVPYYIVDEKIKAKCKVAWIHTDYSKLDGDRKEELKVWSRYSKIVAISDAVKESFEKIYPQLSDKITIIENIVSEKMILEQANSEIIDKEMKKKENETILLSIGRFTTAKNFDNIPEICSMIINKNYKIKWYIIGYGEDEELIRKKIKEYNMEQHVILLGKKDNPYPYIKQCDIYVQPSRFEGKAVTVREAQILHKPVAITDFPTAYSQLEDGIDGIIVPQQNKECADELMSLIENKRLQDELIENCKNKNYSNTDEVEKIYKMI